MYFLANAPLGLEFDPMAFLENLQYMGVGIIFAIISVIIGATLLINFLFSE